jgi:hypothetical protein
LTMSPVQKESTVKRAAWRKYISVSVFLALLAASQYCGSIENTNLLKAAVGDSRLSDGKSWFDNGVQRNALGVAVDGNFAYVGDGPFGIQVIDVSNPVHMRDVAHVDIGGYAKEGIQVRGNVLYALRSSWETSELVLVDVTSPSQPSIVGRVQFPGMAWGLDIAGNQAFVGVDNGHKDNGGLAVIDVSAPSKPSIIGWYRCKKALGVHVVGKRAYVATWEEGVAIVDVSDPTNPTHIGQFQSPSAVYSVFVQDQIAYVAANRTGLQIVDISNPDQPKIIGSFDPRPDANRKYGVKDVVVKDSVAFVTDNSEVLVLLDVSNPAKPVELARSEASHCYGVKLHGNRVYIAAHKAGLWTFEIGGWIRNGSGVAAAVQPLPPFTLSGAQINPSARTASADVPPRFNVAWQSASGWTYTILTTTNDLSSWIPVPDCVDLPGTGELMTHAVSMDQPKQFFRVIARRYESK